MKFLLLFLALVAFFVISLSVWNAIQRKKGITSVPDEYSGDADDEECCGQHAFCEKLNRLNVVSGKAEYFDDEELDAYAGTLSGQYSEEAVEQFREVLSSMYDKDKPDWLQSLQQRGIALPAQLKDEALTMIDNLRAAKQKNDGTV